jgi:hypothetical protein
MPQLQLPIFPADVTAINSNVAVSFESGRVVYMHGLLPVFEHATNDLASFRQFTSQMIANGKVRHSEIAHLWGAPGDGEALCEALPVQRSARLLCTASPALCRGAESGSEGPSASFVGRGQESG